MNKHKFKLSDICFVTTLLAIAMLAHLIINIVNNDENVTEDSWINGVYNQCIISEPNEIASIKIQDNLMDLGRQKVTFYDFNNKAYPATLHVDFIDGVMVNAPLNNNKDAYLNIDYGNHTCELTMYDNSSGNFKPLYDKSGYLGSSMDNKDIDDFYYKNRKNNNSSFKKH